MAQRALPNTVFASTLSARRPRTRTRVRADLDAATADVIDVSVRADRPLFFMTLLWCSVITGAKPTDEPLHRATASSMLKAYAVSSQMYCTQLSRHFPTKLVFCRFISRVVQAR